MTPTADPASGGRGPAARILGGAAHRFVTRGCGLRVLHHGPLPPPPFLVCSNHRSHADSVALMAALALPFNACALLAAQDYFFKSSPHVRLAAAVFTLIAFDRHPAPSSFKAMLDRCRAFIAAGGAALISFPEGTRHMGDGMGPFKRGPATVAATLGLPVVPAFVEGTQHVLPKGRFIPRRAPVTIAFGAPLPAPSVAGREGQRAAALALSSEIADRVRRLAAEVRDGGAAPGGTGDGTQCSA